jgi:hypothetical protein
MGELRCDRAQVREHEDEIVEKANGIVVGILEGDPAARPVIAADQLGGENRLPEPRGRAQQDDPAVPVGREHGEQSLPCDELPFEPRRVKAHPPGTVADSRRLAGFLVHTERL